MVDGSTRPRQRGKKERRNPSASSAAASSPLHFSHLHLLHIHWFTIGFTFSLLLLKVIVGGGVGFEPLGFFFFCSRGPMKRMMSESNEPACYFLTCFSFVLTLSSPSWRLSSAVFIIEVESSFFCTWVVSGTIDSSVVVMVAVVVIQRWLHFVLQSAQTFVYVQVKKVLSLLWTFRGRGTRPEWAWTGFRSREGFLFVSTISWLYLNSVWNFQQVEEPSVVMAAGTVRAGMDLAMEPVDEGECRRNRWSSRTRVSATEWRQVSVTLEPAQMKRSQGILELRAW